MQKIECTIKTYYRCTEKKWEKFSMKVYFLGSGDIAVAPLAKLYESSSINLVGIGTQKDMPAGRKRKLMPTPVGKWAIEHNVEIDKPESVNSIEFLTKLHSLDIDIIFVISFGQLLKAEILELPKVACVNLHASILPKYRGASPIISAIKDGEDMTGVAFMQMEKGLDTGPVYTIFEEEVGDARADELEEKLAQLSALHIEEVLENIVSGKLIGSEQDDKFATYAEKIKKSDGIIDWNESAINIVNKVHAFYPWPGVSFSIPTKKSIIRITITEAEVTTHDTNHQPGETVVADKKQWIIACGDGAIELKRVKPDGKAEMSGADFVRGRPNLFSYRN